MSDASGICPLCEATGSPAEPCRGAICAKRELHFIPAGDFERIQPIPSQDRDPYLGSMIAEYLIVDVLGQGGFGKVYLALQQPLMMPAALKLMRHVGSDGGERLATKFRGEALSLSKLNHPNIVRLLRFGHYRGAPYMVMEYVPGAHTLEREISHRVETNQRLPITDLSHILRQTLNGLESAHEQGIVHRDIKPENIMLQSVTGDPFFVRILDFGLAKFIEQGSKTSAAIGSPYYMAPEQLAMHRIGPWTDLYAVGVIAFELLTGRQPFSGISIQEIIAKKINPRYDPLSQIAELRLPDEVSTFLRQAIARDSDARFRSASAFRDALATVTASLSAKHVEPAPLAAVLHSSPGLGHTADAQSDPSNSSRPAATPPRADEATPPRADDATPPRADETAKPRADETAKPQGAVASSPAEIVDSRDVTGSSTPLELVASQSPQSISARLGLRSFSIKWVGVGLAILLSVGLAIVIRPHWGSPPPERGALDDPPIPPTIEQPESVTGKHAVKKEPRDTNLAVVPKLRPKTDGVDPTVRKPGGVSSASRRCAYYVGVNAHRSLPSTQSVSDPASAHTYCTKACASGDLISCVYLGRLFALGVGRTRDYTMARRLLEKACAGKVGEGCLELARLYRDGHGVAKDAVAMVDQLRKGCAQKHARSCQWLATSYRTGRGVGKDLIKAAENYLTGCLLGDGWSCLNAGVLYYGGKGVSEDKKRALTLFVKACELRVNRGCKYAGFGYLKGTLVPQSDKQAYAYFQKACELRSGEGCQMLGDHLRDGRGVDKSETRAIESYRKSCQLKFSLGCWELGRALKRKRDCKAATSAFARACSLGYKKACRATCGTP
ncbi:MAG: protein kinase [Myxococcales bacterium]|nr:protein kinase [Myxococcales bacterium]